VSRRRLEHCARTGRRLPWLRSAPDRPRRFDLIAAAGTSATVSGAALLGHLVQHQGWALLAAGAVLIFVSTGAGLVHNARIHAL